MNDRADIAHDRLRAIDAEIRRQAHEMMPVMASLADRARALLVEFRARKAEAEATAVPEQET